MGFSVLGAPEHRGQDPQGKSDGTVHAGPGEHDQVRPRAKRGYKTSAESRSPSWTPPCPPGEGHRHEKVLSVRKACGSLFVKNAPGFIAVSQLQVGKSGNRPKTGDPRIVLDDLNEHVCYFAQSSLVPTNAEELVPINGERVELSGFGADLQRLIGDRFCLGDVPPQECRPTPNERGGPLENGLSDLGRKSGNLLLPTNRCRNVTDLYRKRTSGNGQPEPGYRVPDLVGRARRPR